MYTTVAPGAAVGITVTVLVAVGCRVIVGGKTEFACVDGPEFDAHQVDWDMLVRRLGTYREAERASCERFEHECMIDTHGKEPR